MKQRLLFLLLSFAFTSCFQDEGKGPLYISPKTISSNKLPSSVEENLRRKFKLLEEKNLEWKEIQKDALSSFKKIEKIVRKKCYDCHDSNTKLPFYRRPFPRINPINRHQVEGLEAFDFARKFPLKSLGSDNQLSLLNAFRNSVLDRTMPLKSYRLVYPFRKIKKKDQVVLLGWIDPLIEKIEQFEEKYSELVIDTSPKGMAQRVFSAKCFRCHANGTSKGGFGGMEDLEALKKSNFVNLKNPTLSEIFTISQSNEMPPNIKEKLNEEELEIILLWIQEDLGQVL